MPQRPVDVDIRQSVKDLFLAKNEYRLVDDYVLRDGNKHPFAILIPGGGYYMVSSFIEGVPVAKQLNARGISAFIVYYRVKKKARFPAPMDDMARAVREIFSKAEQYNLDTENYQSSSSKQFSEANKKLSEAIGTHRTCSCTGIRLV